MCTDTFKRGRLKSLRLRRQVNGKLINDSKLQEEPSVKKWIPLEAYQAIVVFGTLLILLV